MTSGFRGEVVENCALLGYHTAYCGNYLPKFLDSLSVPFSRTSRFCLKMGQNGCPESSVRIYQYTMRTVPEERR